MAGFAIGLGMAGFAIGLGLVALGLARRAGSEVALVVAAAEMVGEMVLPSET